jgi:hypothetical protein
MSAPGHPPPPAPASRRDVLGMIAVVVGAAGLLPGLLVFLVGLIPSMNAIWWLGLVLIPLLAVLGVAALVLGVVGIVRAARRHGRFVLSVIGLVLGLVLVAPAAWLLLGAPS